MKVFVIFVNLLAIALARINYIPSPSVDEDNIKARIRSKGYEIEKYDVNTRDGYILDLYRIPRYPQEQQPNVTYRPKAVLLMHGFMSSLEDFVVNEMSLRLADTGYDVYLGNARGSRYGLRHTYLKPYRDTSFWRYTFEEIGTRDLPAIIDKVLEINKRQNLSYIGHMEGTTWFYVMASERPEYLKKINRMISLGPIAYMQHSNNEILKTIAKNMNRQWLITNVGINKVKLSDDLLNVAKNNCNNSIPEICNNDYFLLKGYNSTVMDQTIIIEIIDRVPFGGSARELIHLAQIISTGRFQRYDPSFDNVVTKQYDLSRINVPTCVIYTRNDSISSVDDVKRLIEELPNVYYSTNMKYYDNNLNLVYGNFPPVVLKEISDCLRSDLPEKDSI